MCRGSHGSDTQREPSTESYGTDRSTSGPPLRPVEQATVWASIDTSRVADAGISEDESPDKRTFDYARTVALSDGVFAIALTLLVLNIGVPVLARGNHGELGSSLLDREGEFASYALSFAVIALLWVRHRWFFRVLDKIDTRTTVLNLVYLGFIAFLPYPTRVLGLYGNEPASVVLYASTVASVATIAALMRVHTSAPTYSPTPARAKSPAGRTGRSFPQSSWCLSPSPSSARRRQNSHGCYCCFQTS